jgi:hypothetical protein
MADIASFPLSELLSPSIAQWLINLLVGISSIDALVATIETSIFRQFLSQKNSHNFLATCKAQLDFFIIFILGQAIDKNNKVGSTYTS